LNSSLIKIAWKNDLRIEMRMKKKEKHQGHTECSGKKSNKTSGAPHALEKKINKHQGH